MLHPPSQVEESLSTVTPDSLRPAHRAQHASLSQPAPDQTAYGPLTVSHDASARHSKRGHTHLGCVCTLGAYHHIKAPQVQVILAKPHHHAEGLVPCRRSKSRRRVSVYRCRSVTPITPHKF